MPSRPIRIGTRGSALALAQAHETRDRLARAHGLDEERFEIVIIKTSGDRILDRPLSEVGGKGLFTKEIEEAMIAGEIDLAVHSSKDMPTVLPPGLALTAFLPREDVRDAFLSPKAASLAELPEGARVGTSSLRRQAMVRRLRPDLDVVDYRGNVQTRLKKLAEGVVDATLLAAAGLNRLGLAGEITSIIETEDFLPAVGQGAICIESREDDDETRSLLVAIHDETTAVSLAAERAFLAELDGSCRTPIGGLARATPDGIAFSGIILSVDGSEAYTVERTGPAADAASLGADAGRELRARAGAEFFARLGIST
ncbi:MAG: hydroxymethylbilane synthase [Hyphomicrobiales bacterium]|nr:hydroxymethylbilane synthase [Hyphomicrobiales bacterium]